MYLGEFDGQGLLASRRFCCQSNTPCTANYLEVSLQHFVTNDNIKATSLVTRNRQTGLGAGHSSV